ncbi:MAG: RNA polymerase sigma factor [Polyangia bacterium]
MAPLDDKTLMENLARGDRQALRVIYERHAEFVYRVAYRFAGSEEDARDITQSVFVTIMQSAGRYKAKGKLRTWIYRVVVNRCLKHRTRADRRLRAELTDRDFEEIPAADENRPDRIAQRAERAGKLWAAIRELPQRQRVALISSRFEGQSYEEIANALGSSKKSVESLIVRARRSLAKSFSK